MNTNIFTIDLEDWFHLAGFEQTKTEKQWEKFQYKFSDNVKIILDILEEQNQKPKATFFSLGWIAKQYPDIIKEISNKGYEIGSHSNMHQLAYEQNHKDFKYDLLESIKIIEDITGEKVSSYRAPSFSITEENKHFLEILIDCGIERDCSIFPIKRENGGFENLPSSPFKIEINGKHLKEFPLNTGKILNKEFVFSGGGYLRLFPYWFIDKMIQKNDYTMIYLHPHDFDVNRPIIEDLSIIKKFKHTVGLGGTEDKIRKILKKYDFIDSRQADKQINWNKAPTIKL